MLTDVVIFVSFAPFVFESCFCFSVISCFSEIPISCQYAVSWSLVLELYLRKQQDVDWQVYGQWIDVMFVSLGELVLQVWK